MTEQNLIIDGVDHAKFDFEWAKRGGVVKTGVCEQPAFAKCLGVKQDGRALFMFFINEDENERWHYGFVCPQNFNTLSMATPSECAEAGIEYIEPPARWLPIEVFPPPQYTWLGDEQDKPKIISVDDWEDYEIRNNRSIVCNKSGLVVEAYEWFGKWYHLVNDGGDCYQQLINPTHFQYLPKPQKDE